MLTVPLFFLLWEDATLELKMKPFALILCFFLPALSAEEIYYGEYLPFEYEKCCKDNPESFYLSADYLYWSNDFGLPIGITLNLLNFPLTSFNPIVLETETQVNVTIARPSNHFSSGVRVGFGCDLGCNDWDFFCSWTNFFNKSTLNTPVGNIVDVVFTEAHSTFTFNYNLADFELGKVIDLGSDLYIRPFIGIRGAWLEQKINLNLSGNFAQNLPLSLDMPAFVRIKQCSFGVGPRMGLDTSWGNFCGFSLIGNLSGALVYSRPKAHYNVVATGINSSDNSLINFSITNIQISDSYWQLNPNVQMLFGLNGRWDFPFLGSSLNVFAGWESTYWWEGTKIIIIEQAVAMQGLTISLSYSF